MSRRAWRAQQLIIDTPTPGADPWVTIVVQQVFINDDGSLASVTPRYDRIYRRAQDIFSETIMLTDRLTQQPAFLSAVGIFEAIERLAIPWLEQQYGGELGLSGWIEETI